MKAFIIASIILSLVIVIILTNSFYVTNKIDELMSVCIKLKAGSTDTSPEELLGMWQNCRALLSMSIHTSNIEKAENAIIRLCSYKSGEDFNAELSVLISTLTRISNSQSFAIDMIF